MSEETQIEVKAKARAFLAAYRLSASITKAAAAAGITRHVHYNWLETSEAYRAAFLKAQIEAGDILEDEAIDRVMVGVYEPIVYQGAFTYPQIWNEVHERWEDDRTAPPLGIYRKSEGLLHTLLKGFKPEKYGQKVEVTGANGGPVSSALTVTFVKPQE